MAKSTTNTTAIVGVAEHGNCAEFVTIMGEGVFVDRRRISLTPEGTPTHPYHHEGAWAVGRYKDSAWARDITLEDAIVLIENVHKLAEKGAKDALDLLSKDVAAEISGIAIRLCPPLPDTIEARIRDNRAQTVADSVMYRRALAIAATNIGWAVSWYDRDTVFSEASKALGGKDIKAVLNDIGRDIGPPWQARHKLAAAAAITALS